MGDAPQNGGYIKLWRSLLFNGHLQMPDQPFKLFIFLLLKVNRFPGSSCETGDGWVTYEMIQKWCCSEDGPKWSPKTISKALSYLEDGKYIQRLKEKDGAKQRIRVIKFAMYQDETASLEEEVWNEPLPPGKRTSSPREVKQERREETTTERGAPMTDWVKWFEGKFATLPSQTDMGEMQKLQARGVTDELIIAMVEQAIADDADRPLIMAKRRISDLLPYDVKTVEDWRRREAAKKTKQQAKDAASSKPRHVTTEDDVARKLRELEEKKHGEPH